MTHFILLQHAFINMLFTLKKNLRNWEIMEVRHVSNMHFIKSPAVIFILKSYYCHFRKQTFVNIKFWGFCPRLYKFFFFLTSNRINHKNKVRSPQSPAGGSKPLNLVHFHLYSNRFFFYHFIKIYLSSESNRLVNRLCSIFMTSQELLVDHYVYFMEVFLKTLMLCPSDILDRIYLVS